MDSCGRWPTQLGVMLHLVIWSLVPILPHLVILRAASISSVVLLAGTVWLVLKEPMRSKLATLSLSLMLVLNLGVVLASFQTSKILGTAYVSVVIVAAALISGLAALKQNVQVFDRDIICFGMVTPILCLCLARLI